MAESAKFASDGMTEEFFCLQVKPGLDFSIEFDELFERYEAMATETSEIVLRLHLSDPANQIPLIKARLAGRKSMVSWIGQPPVDGSRVALEAWHWHGPSVKKTKRPDGGLYVRLNHYQSLFYRCHDNPAVGSLDQTTFEFDQLNAAIGQYGGTLADNLERTWIYCQDVDNNYAGLVKSRKAYFERQNLTAETHYIASTGIEGKQPFPGRVIAMDSFSLFGHRQQQIEYLKAPDMLSPTQLYGVTFERGTRIIYGDRSHYFISGTASIDHKGEVVHTGDVRQQTGRMIANIEALLNNHNGRLEDIRQAVVYLRDAADAGAVRKQLEHLLPADIPLLMVAAPVCRPGWLVEMEAIAVNANGCAGFKKLQ